MKKTINRATRVRTVYLTDGRNAALNFINTCKKDSKGSHKELLGNYSQFLDWCQESGAIDDSMWAQLDLEQYCYEEQAKMVFAEAMSLRTVLSEVFDALARRECPEALWLGHFNKWVQTVNAHTQYQAGERGLAQFWADINENSEAPLWLIVQEATQLIDTGGINRLKKCPLCDALFMDVSNSGTRIWCNPNTCGASRKSAQYHLRRNRKNAEKLVEIG